MHVLFPFEREYVHVPHKNQIWDADLWKVGEILQITHDSQKPPDLQLVVQLENQFHSQAR